MRRFLPTLGLLTLLAWAGPASAECQNAYTAETLVSDLQTLNLALRNLDETVYATSAKRLEAGIVCLGGQAPPPIFASAYRYIGTYHYLVLHDEPGARRWFRTALEIDPTHEWDATELELSHPMREVYEQERLIAPTNLVELPGKAVNLPAGSKLAIDGRPLVDAVAAIDRPHVVQQIATDRTVRGTWLIEGNAIPEKFLKPAEGPVAAAATEEPKKTKKGKKPKDAAETSAELQVQTLERLRPPEKTPLLIAGALGVLGAGGVYAASWFSRQEFDAAHTTEDMEQTRTMTNTLVLASGGVLLVGAGVGYWGIVLDGGAGIGVAGHF